MPPEVAAERPTAVTRVHAELRRKILSGDLAPGTWLRQEDLASALSVSRMPVREAISLLSEEGLVDLFPHRGACVAMLTLDELEELYAARVGLEGLAARLAAVRITDADLEHLRQRLPELAALCASGEADRYLALDREFMLRCYGVANRARLVAQVTSLRDRANRYLRLVFIGADHMRWLDHSYRLFQAFAAHDADAADTVARGALEWTLVQAREMLEDRLAVSDPVEK